MSDFSLISGISSIPFSLKTLLSYSSLNSASYEKCGMLKVSGQEDHVVVDSGEKRMMVSEEQDEESSEYP